MSLLPHFRSAPAALAGAGVTSQMKMVPAAMIVSLVAEVLTSAQPSTGLVSMVSIFKIQLLRIQKKYLKNKQKNIGNS